MKKLSKKATWIIVAALFVLAILLIIEKLFLKKFLDKIPKVFSILYTLFWVLISWIIFDATSFNEIAIRLSTMFGLSDKPFINAETIYYLKSYAVLFIIGFIGATPLFKNLVLKEKFKKI